MNESGNISQDIHAELRLGVVVAVALLGNDLGPSREGMNY